MDTTRSRIILYALAGVAALTVPVLLSGGTETDPPRLFSLALALYAIALLARTSLKQLDAAHNLSAQLGRMIEHGDIRDLVVPAPGCPEMNAVGHQLNVLIYALSDTKHRAPAARPEPHRRIPQPDQNISLSVVADAT